MENSQFIGPRKVESVIVLETKTPKGEAMIEVTYAGEFKETMSQKLFDASTTSEASDYTNLRDKRVRIISPEIVAILQEYDIRVCDVDSILRMAATEVDNRFNRAVGFLWTGDDSTFVPGMNPIVERSILEAEAILAKIPAKVENNESGEEKTV